MAMLTYGSGLRLLECLRWRVKDVDFHYKQLMVPDAKGHSGLAIRVPVITALDRSTIRQPTPAP